MPIQDSPPGQWDEDLKAMEKQADDIRRAIKWLRDSGAPGLADAIETAFRSMPFGGPRP